jgi:hypothetical protein
MIRSKSFGYATAFVVAASTFGTLSTNARGDGDSGKAVAEALFRDAKQLMEAGDVATACPKFAESLNLDRTLGTLLYLGACHEQQGRTASAWSEFSSALTWAQRSGQADRVAFAQKHVDALEPRLAYIVITAPAIPSLQLRVDDALLNSAAIGTPLPVDPGSHLIEASAPNMQSWQEKVTVPSEPGKTPVEVPPLVPAPVATTAPVTPTTGTTPATPTAPPADNDGGRRAILWTSVAFTGVGVVVGSIFGALTLSARDTARSECPNNQCTSQDGLNKISDARTDATVSTVGFVAAGVGAAVATYFAISLLHDSGKQHVDASAATTTLRSLKATPTIFAHHGGGLALQGQF